MASVVFSEDDASVTEAFLVGGWEYDGPLGDFDKFSSGFVILDRG